MVYALIEKTEKSVIVSQWKNDLWRESGTFGNQVTPVGIIPVTADLWRELGETPGCVRYENKYQFPARMADTVQVICAIYKTSIDHYPANYPAFAVEYTCVHLKGETQAVTLRAILRSYVDRNISEEHWNKFPTEIFNKGSFGPLGQDIRYNNTRFRSLIKAIRNYWE